MEEEKFKPTQFFSPAPPFMWIWGHSVNKIYFFHRKRYYGNIASKSFYSSLVLAVSTLVTRQGIGLPGNL